MAWHDTNRNNTCWRAPEDYFTDVDDIGVQLAQRPLLFMNDHLFAARNIFVYLSVSEHEGGWCVGGMALAATPAPALAVIHNGARALRQRRRRDARAQARVWRRRFLERALDDLPDVHRYSITCAYVLVLNPLVTNRCWEDHGYVGCCCLWVSDSSTSDWFQQRRVQVVTRQRSRGARCRMAGSRPPRRRERSISSTMPPAPRPGSTLEYVSICTIRCILRRRRADNRPVRKVKHLYCHISLSFTYWKQSMSNEK